MAARRLLAGALLLAALCADVREAAAQTSADLFNDQALQRIDLYVNTRDWYWLRALPESSDYYPANMKWNGTTLTNVGIRLRGSGSRSTTKPALRVDFDRYDAGRTFLGLSAISLRNNVQDPSGVRELLTMKTYRAMGLKAPRMAPAALYINNAYFGSYTLTEEIDEAFLASVFGERPRSIHTASRNRSIGPGPSGASPPPARCCAWRERGRKLDLTAVLMEPRGFT